MVIISVEKYLLCITQLFSSTKKSVKFESKILLASMHSISDSNSLRSLSVASEKIEREEMVIDMSVIHGPR